MISKSNRFHGHNSLNYVYKRGNVARTECMSLRFASSKRPDYRLAVVVSRKVSKSAVVRNRIRRRIYEAVRLERKASSLPWKYDFVMSVFDERIANMPTEELVSTVSKLLGRAR